ncbi:DUF6223 family protein [Antrihabitans stalactiti]|uniref:Major facilitator superfamily (MFS) profile domain-containing protein n=1 Tax=Antrihabitans stalactiti TaxID=2584121 RepID=A0A848KJB5_9NOCA|nr:DUF6223 family protein [Antrihabitans stalactiti]NMN96772.1 hypothetical protein [Antrihabitans stalactiti]
MSVRNLPAVVAAAVLGAIALAAPATAAAEQTAVSGITSGRVGPTITALVGLIGVVVGSLTLARAGRIGTGNARRGAIVALGSGLISVALGGLFAAMADGGPGTGNGIVGAYVAVVLGLIGLVLGGLTLNRSRAASPTR